MQFAEKTNFRPQGQVHLSTSCNQKAEDQRPCARCKHIYKTHINSSSHLLYLSYLLHLLLSNHLVRVEAS